MHRAIGYLSKRLVYIKAGEGRKVWLTCLYFFLVITAYYVIKPVSRSLVLDDLGSRLVPYVDLLSALVMGPMVALFARLVDRVEKHRLVSLTFGAVTATLGAFWWLLASPAPWVSAAFYVWVAIFSVLVVTLFWLVANDLYHPREAKRLFGIIGSGGILGGIVGSGIAAAGARLIGTRQLLVCSGVILLVCWIVVQRLWRFAPAHLERPSARRADAPPAGRQPRTFQLLTRSRYLILLVGLVGIAKIVSTLIYYQFNPFIEAMFPDADAKTAFTAMFFGWVNVASFLVQFLFTSWVLRRMGLMFALLALPVGLVGGSLGLLLVPAFWIAATTELYDGSMNYSLQQTTKEVLYLPIDRSIRYKVKPFIDMVVFRFGKGVAAVIGIICLDRLHLDARVLGYISVPLIALWLVLVVQLRADYVRTIRRLLKARATVRHRRAQRAQMERRKDVWAALVRPSFTPARPEEWLDSLQPPHAARQKIVFTRRLFSLDGMATRDELEQLLLSLERSGEVQRHPDVAGASPELLRRLLTDSHQPSGRRTEALKALVRRGGQEEVDDLLGLLLVEEDAEMRHEFIRGLVTLRLGSGHGLEFPKRLIRRQIAKEVGDSERLVRLAAIYHRMCEGRLREQDPFVALLRLLMEEATLRIFWLLSLVYRPEDIYLIYKQVRESDDYLRADALELLDNLVDPSLRWIILPVLDEDRFLERMSNPLDGQASDVEAACGILRSGVHDHNRWLSLMIVWLAGQLRLESLWPDLDAVAKRHAVLEPAVRAVRRMTSS